MPQNPMYQTPPFNPNSSSTGQSPGGLPNLDWKSLLFLAFQPQALGLLQAITQMRQQQEDRQYQMEERRLRRQDADTDLQLGLHKAGAIRGNPEMVKAVTGVLGQPPDPRAQVDTRVGTFYLPTEKEETEKALSVYRAKQYADEDARLAARAAQDAREMKTIDLPGVGQVTIKRADEARIRMEAKRLERTGAGQIITQGDVLMRVKPNTNVAEPIVDKDGNPIRIYRAPNVSEERLALDKEKFEHTKSKAEKPKPMPKHVMDGIDEVQALLDAARSGESGDPQKPYSAAQRNELYQRAIQKGNQLKEAYPDYVEFAEGDQGTYYIKPRQGGQQNQQSASVTVTPPPTTTAPKTFPANKLAAFAESKGWMVKGQADIRRARNYIISQGYSIDENQ